MLCRSEGNLCGRAGSSPAQGTTYIKNRLLACFKRTCFYKCSSDMNFHPAVIYEAIKHSSFGVGIDIQSVRIFPALHTVT